MWTRSLVAWSCEAVVGTTWIVDRLLPETAAGVPTAATPFTSGSSLASVVHAARA